MKKNLLIAILMAAILIGILPMITPAVVLVSPATDTNHTGTMTINVTFVNSTDVINPILANSTLYCNTSGTWSVITMTAFSCTDPECAATVDVDALTDTLSMACNISLGNVSGANATDATPNLDITIDSTNPLCDIQLDHSHIAWKDTQEITWTSSDALSLARTALDIDGPETFTTVEYTDANRDLPLSSQDTKYIGDWTVNMTAYDRAGNTCTASDTFKSYLPEKLPEEEIPAEPAIPKTLIVLVIAGIIAYFIFFKKK